MEALLQLTPKESPKKRFMQVFKSFLYTYPECFGGYAYLKV